MGTQLVVIDLEANQSCGCEGLKHFWLWEFMRDEEDDEDGVLSWVSETQQMGIVEVWLVEGG